MSTDYLPRTDAELKTFATNFATLIKAAPATYGLVAADATTIDNAARDYAARYDLAFSPATRTQLAISDKIAAKATLTAILRGYAMQVKSNRAVSDAAKLALGIGVYDFTATPISAPATRPQVSIAGVDVRQHRLLFTDSSTPDKRAKPAGAAGLQLFCHVGDGAGAPADPLSSRFHAFHTKATLTMTFQPADAGKTAYYYARWQTATGLVGPWSLLTSMPIVG